MHMITLFFLTIFFTVGPVFMTALNSGKTDELEANPKSIKRFGSVIGLKKEYEERYIILHRHTFPGVLERIRKCNIRNYSIFLRNGILFSHFEYVGQDFDADMARMGDEVTKDWWKLTDPMQEPLTNRKEGEWWASMELLYEMNRSTKPYQNAQRTAFVAALKAGRKQEFKARLEETDDALRELYLKHNVQNLTFYYHDGHVYFYSEYVGEDYAKDMNELFKNEAMRAMDADLAAFLLPPPGSENTRVWQPMREVFHTD
jgi:L-rhamnose mutarotase